MSYRILVATDGSEGSMEALKMANYYAECGAAEEVELLTVIPELTGFRFSFGDTEDYRKEGEKRSQAILEKAAAELSAAKTVNQQIVSGEPAVVICEQAKEKKCDLIIMGSRGNGQLKGLLVGSVSMKVLQYAECPVLVVKA